MREKIRLIIIIVLACLLAISAFVGMQTYASKKAAELEKNALENENANLSKKIEEITRERKQLLERVNALTNDLNKASEGKEELSKQYEVIVQERDGLVNKVKDLQKNNEQIRVNLSKLKQEKQKLNQDLEANLAPLKDENAKLKQQLDDLSGLKSKLESELGELKGEKSDLEQKFNQIDSFLEQKLTRLRYLNLKEQIDAIRSSTGTQEAVTTATQQSASESVELPPIVVLPQATSKWETQKSTMSVRQTGAVIEVNKENKFVIIDLGQNAGTKIGDTLSVFRQGKPVASIEVIQVRQNIAACDIKEETMPVEAGDVVR